MPALVSTGVEFSNTSVQVRAFPEGGIIEWYGDIMAIPTGWKLCDGTNGTPDLRDRFVIGAGLTYAVGAVGGQTTVTLTAPQLPSHSHPASATTSAAGSHTHSASSSTDPNHSHGYSVTARLGNSGPNQFAAGAARWGSGSVNTANPHNHSLPWSGTVPDHSHSVAISSVSSSPGGGGAHNNMPPYFALVYIQKA